MNAIKDIVILEKLKYSLKEAITNIVFEDMSSSGTDLSKLKIEFDKTNSSIIHITLPEIISNSIRKQ